VQSSLRRRIIGAIIQNGYVVRDSETAMRHWIEVLALGYRHSVMATDFRVVLGGGGLL
jgi:hypothetical protein